MLLSLGYRGYLCNMVDSIVVEPSIKNIPTVCEFPDVFPNDIPRMDSLSEVDFCIDFLPGVTLISKLHIE